MCGSVLSFCGLDSCGFLGTMGSVPGGGGWLGPAMVTGSSDDVAVVAVDDADEGSVMGGGVLLLVGFDL